MTSNSADKAAAAAARRPALRMRDGEGLCLEDAPLARLARDFGTPLYAYSRAAIEDNWRAFDAAFGARPHLVCYAVKACSNIAALGVLARLGSGFDIVSGGELERVLRAGGDPARVVFSGVGKRPDELARALEVGIGCFNVESEAELDMLEAAARARSLRAPVAARVNPDIRADTHAHMATGGGESKFGLSPPRARAILAAAARSDALEARGASVHIGSQITELAPFARAAEALVAFADDMRARGVPLDQLDFGGGLGIAYGDAAAPPRAAYVQALLEAVGDRPHTLVVEPGRAVIGDAGVLLTRVLLLKPGAGKQFAVVDAAMNDLLRPALYGAVHEVREVAPRRGPARRYDVVGPVCESGDFLARDCELAIAPGDLLAALDAGAYAFSMAGNYNSRPRAAEAMVSGARADLIRARETVAALMEGERVLDD